MKFIGELLYNIIYDFLFYAYVRFCGLEPLGTSRLRTGSAVDCDEPSGRTQSGDVPPGDVPPSDVPPGGTGAGVADIIVVRTGSANFYIYSKGTYSVVIDSGFGIPVIKRELKSLSVDPGRVSAVLLTHSDFDHTGGISLFHNATVYLSHNEEQMITKKTSRKYRIVYNGRIKGKYTLLRDDSEITIGPIHIRAIETPGHTPGSMSYLLDGAVLFTGDAFRILKGKVQPIGPFFNMDQNTHIESIKKVAQLKNIQLLLTGHRGYSSAFEDAMEHWK